MTDDPGPHLREAYSGLDGVHDALSQAKRAYGRQDGAGCPCGPKPLRDALESVQDAELELEALIWPEGGD